MRTLPIFKKTPILVIAVAMIAAITGSAQSRTPTAPPQSASTLPDVVGIHPGISAQEAYNLLKARSPQAKIGIGQFRVAGVTDQPVPVSMSIGILNAEPAEVITVWLTTPPSQQVVWAVGRQIEFEQNKQLLRSNVIAGLRQKYGPETDAQHSYWAFDEQGRRSYTAGQKDVNCAGRANWSLTVAPPQDSKYDSFTPLLYAPGPPTPCDSLVEVRATLDSPRGPDYVVRVTVIVSDLALARRSQEAYQAFLANAGEAKNKEEIEKARQRKGPAF